MDEMTKPDENELNLFLNQKKGEPLDPREAALKAEGEKMLDAVQQMSGKSNIVGADGQPVKVEDPRKVAFEANRKRREELSVACVALMDENKAMAECASMLNLWWHLFHWLTQEMLTYEKVTPEIVQHLNAAFSAKVRQKGYALTEVLSMIKSKLSPFLHEKIRHYAERKRIREMEIREIEKRIGKQGIKLPCNSLSQLFKGQIFRPGMLLILHGGKEAVQAAMKEIYLKNSREYWWSFICGSEALDKSCPEAWWSNCAVENGRFEEVMKVIPKDVVLLFVEDIPKMYLDDGGVAKSPEEKTALALSKLQTWAYENMVACVVGIGEEIMVPPQDILPSCVVRLQEFDGKKGVVVGNDFLKFGVDNESSREQPPAVEPL